jgi:hypothetical protein
MYYPGYSQVVVADNLKVQTILTITQSFPMILTTNIDHDYVAGMIVRFLIPSIFGMVELNALDGQVIGVTNNSLTINLDSTNFTPFAYPNPLPNAYTNPSVIPNGSGPYLQPQPLPYGNQDSFQGVIYNAGLP